MEAIKSRVFAATAAVLITSLSSPAHADEIVLVWTCEDCTALPQPTKVTFDPVTRLFGAFLVQWNGVALDFTFPNAQPAFVRQWFWDALNERPISETALPGPQATYPIRWFAGVYTPDTNGCFQFRIAASGADRCSVPPFAASTVFPANDGGTATHIAPPYVDALVSAFTGAGPGRQLQRTAELVAEYYEAGDVQAACATLAHLDGAVDKWTDRRKPKLSPAEAMSLRSMTAAVGVGIDCP
jgi:hypothetical protein